MARYLVKIVPVFYWIPDFFTANTFTCQTW